MSEFIHETVLLAETVAWLRPLSGRTYVDATLGGGGHARALLEASSPDGRVVGVDRDPAALAAAGERLCAYAPRVLFVAGKFGDLREQLAALGIERVAGLVADLGVSSPQLDRAERGFSFARPGPLDMRMNPGEGESLAELIERLDAGELADVIYQYGDERKSRPIARSIKEAEARGELSSTEDLRRAIVRVLGPKRGGIDPATRTFQALRIAVNAEIEQLAQLLRALPELLEDGGRAAIISFHSGEDRMVKHAFRDDERLTVLTKKPVEATAEEAALNPRARSAKLRVVERKAREQSR